MTEVHNPKNDGYHDQWAVSGLEGLNIRDYEELLQHLGGLGLVVTVSGDSIAEILERGSEFLITEEGLHNFAEVRGLSPHSTTGLWTALNKEEAQTLAGVETVIERGNVIGVSGQSVVRAIASGALSSVYGLKHPGTVSRGILQEFIISQIGIDKS